MVLHSINFTASDITLVAYGAVAEVSTVSDSWFFVLPVNCWDADVF